VWSDVSLSLILRKVYHTKSKWYPKKQGKSYGKLSKAPNVLNWSDRVKTLGLWKGISLAEVGQHYGENEASTIFETVWNNI
jgi:hypothetical protein